LDIGEDVNNGDVTNALDETTAQLDLSDLERSGPSKVDFAAFQAKATGTCHDNDTQTLFANVVWKEEGGSLYNCWEVGVLCKCM
jgi:hypothetical protein